HLQRLGQGPGSGPLPPVRDGGRGLLSAHLTGPLISVVPGRVPGPTAPGPRPLRFLVTLPVSSRLHSGSFQRWVFRTSLAAVKVFPAGEKPRANTVLLQRSKWAFSLPEAKSQTRTSP